MHRIGPDLHDVVARRERGWLVRWLKEPDRVLADKDPLATALFEKYNRVAMPNVRLTEVDVKSLLDFLTEVGARPVDRARLARQ
jgi:cbb3-type cytochrome oxidase cytochrome c subunit